jgi:hypothetical protein
MQPKESHMKQILKSERGMALAIAIVALVVVGALVAGAFFAGTQEQRVGENSGRMLQSFGVAEEGAYEVINKWQDSIGVYNAQAVYPNDSVAFPHGGGGSYPTVWLTAANKTGVYGGHLYKLNDEQYFIDMTGLDSVSLRASAGALRHIGGGGRQRIGLLARIKPLVVDVQAALTTGKGNVVAGNAVISGYDQSPTGWPDCGPLDNPKAGIRADTGTVVTQQGSSQIMGMPAVKRDGVVTDSTFSKYGDVTYAQLAARANITLPGQDFNNFIQPSAVNGVCNKADLRNWGDGVNRPSPTNCAGYYPIVHITGDLTVAGRQGQGILLVDGNLNVTGGFQWFGVTIVKGKLSTAGGGGNPAHFWGGVMVQDSATISDNSISGSANLLYSRCAILKALDATGVVSLMRSRGWVQLF